MILFTDRGFRRSALVLLAAALCAGDAQGQEPRSALLAKELSLALDQGKLDAVAAKHPEGADQFAAALYFPGSQLLIISARYSVPALITEKLAQKAYRDIYLDLNSASIPESRVFIQDVLADGIRPGGAAADSYESSSVRVSFDGDYKQQKMSEADYSKALAAAEESYAKILTALLAELKKTS